MRVTILGGGGFRVPLIYQALAQARAPTSGLVLHDVDPRRLQVIAAVCARIATTWPTAPPVHTTTDLDEALDGAEMIFCAIRVGGTAGRVLDEQVAIDAGLLGQETIGAGGLAYGLRTVPVVDRIAARIAQVAPESWTINFTNPAGLITEAMRAHLGERVFGICDTPLGLVRRVARLLQVPLAAAQVDYQGVNHLGWLTGFWHEDRDLLPGLLADDQRLGELAEAQILGSEQIRNWGGIPNEYLFYYTSPTPDAGPTRGQFLATQQQAFYAAGPDGPVHERWQEALARRDATYMAEARAGSRTGADIATGGYHEVAVQLMSALHGMAPAPGQPRQMILGVVNRGAIAQLPDDAVVEVPVIVDDAGGHPTPLRTSLGPEQIEAVVAVKTAERRLIAAARSRSRAGAVAAFAAHPLVGSEQMAEHLVDAYARAHRQIGELLDPPG